MSSNTGSRPPSLSPASPASKAEVKSRVREKNSISGDFETFFVDEEGAWGRTIIATAPKDGWKEGRKREIPSSSSPSSPLPPLDINIHLHPLRPLQLPAADGPELSGWRPPAS